MTVTTLSAPQMVAYGESHAVIDARAHPLGDLVRMSDESAVLATYFRNNVLHLFALPSLVACAFISNARVRTEDMQRLAWRIYPYIAAELFLRWSEEELPAVVDGVLAASRGTGLIEPDRRSAQLAPPAARPRRRPCSCRCWRRRPCRPSSATTWRWRCCVQAGSGEITQQALEERCQLTAQRMTMLYGFNSPEFFDRTHVRELHRSAARARRGPRGAGGKLEFDEVLMRVAQDAQFVLSEQIRHSILQVMHS